VKNHTEDLSVSSFKFDKSLRLLNAKAYKSVFDDAKLKVSTAEILILARINDSAIPRLGLVIAKKNAKHAVQRNRIKRIARESFRLRQHQLKGIDTVVLARRNLDKMDNVSMQRVFNRLWQQLEQKAEKHAAKVATLNTPQSN
jgi:ribonuclease P protein component